MPPAQRLIIFTRPPLPGRAKTRLIPALGPQGAADLHRQMTEDTLAWALALAQREPVRLEVRHDGPETAAMRAWLGLAPLYRPQGDGDLGQRMARALHEALAEGEQRVVLVGTDCPGRDDAVLAQAFAALEGHDLVLGPALDGGYYLIGLKKPTPALFVGMAWGGGQVLAQTLAAAKEAGLSVHLLPALGDVDEPQDLPRWQEAPRPPRLEAAPGLISVVMPALNEAPRLAQTLGPLLATPGVEVLVVDGGSRDGTLELARSLGARALLGFQGRARQMNLGAALARGQVLLFLHADTRLPPGWAPEVRRLLAAPGAAWGCFSLGLDLPGRRFRLLERLVAWRTRRLGLPYGDQALFLPAALFRQLGGYPDLPIMEDYQLARALGRRGRVAFSPLKALTSGRRWRRLGLVRVTLLNQAVILGFHLGLDPARLRRWYDA